MDTIFTTSNPVHKKVSKHSLVTNMTSCPQEFQHQIKQSVDKFVRCMHDTKGQSVDFFSWPFFWAFDMTFAMLFGSHFGFMESRSDFNGMIDSFTRVVRPAALLGQVPEWCPFFLGNNTFMTTMRKFKDFPDPTQVFLAVRPYCPMRLDI
jgi:Cytochrome P450